MSVKTAKTEAPNRKYLQERWSPRAFADKSIERDKVKSLFEGARCVSSCLNEQPWHFIIASKDNIVEYQCIPETFRISEGALRSRKRLGDFVFKGNWSVTFQLTG